MKRYWTLACALCVFFLALFGLAQWMGFDLTNTWADAAQTAGMETAVISIGLLVIDVILPIPSSLIMLGNGSVFGVGLGTLISTLGCFGATLVAFSVGRYGAGRVTRFVGPEEQRRANLLLERWGVAAIILSRPLPLLAETVAMLAGASSMSWSRLIVSALASAVPLGLLYALTGAGAAKLDHIGAVLGILTLVAALIWFITRRIERRLT